MTNFADKTIWQLLKTVWILYIGLMDLRKAGEYNSESVKSKIDLITIVDRSTLQVTTSAHEHNFTY